MLKITTLSHLSIAFILYFFSFNSYALFCPTNFAQIDVGDSIAKVTAACGKTDVEETKEVKDEGPQEWSYFIPQTVATQTAEQAQGTLKTQIAFDSTGKVLNISVNGIGVGSTTICGTSVSLGDSKESVKNACGDPIFVNKQQEDTNKKDTLPANKETTYTYTNSNPPITLKFENGKLVSKE